MADTASKRSRAPLVIFGLVAAAILLYFALPGSRNQVVVRTARVHRATLVNIAPTNGRVEPVDDFQPRSLVASEVELLPVHLGEHVSRGQELVRLDTSDAQSRLSQAQASLSGAENTLTNMEAGGSEDELAGERSDLAAAQAQQAAASQSLTTLEALQAKGAASANEVAAAQQRLSDNQAKVHQLQDRLHGRYSNGDLNSQRLQVSEARAALAAAHSGLAGADIRAPFSGTVYALPFAQFDYVPPGDAVISVADLDRLQVRAYFDEPVIGKLSVGQPVTISWEAKPQRLWHGHVTQVPATVVTYNGTRNVGVCLISVDDAQGDLLPNVTVTVRVTTSQHTDVLSIPREALYPEGARNFVYRVVKDRLVKTPVVVREGDVNLTQAGIASGLAEGDVVALRAETDVDLADGMRVKPESP